VVLLWRGVITGAVFRLHCFEVSFAVLLHARVLALLTRGQLPGRKAASDGVCR
jgi:hypothetical protein